MSALPILKIADVIKNPDKPFLTKGLIKDKFLIWGNKMVNKTREISTSWAAPILLISLLGYNVYTNQQANTRLDAFKLESDKQHDLLIEMRTLNQIAKEEKIQEKIDKKLDKDLDDVYRKKMTEKMDRLELIVQGRFPNSGNQ